MILHYSIFFPCSWNIVFNCATVMPQVWYIVPCFRVTEGQKSTQYKAIYLKYTTASHFQPHFRIADFIKVTCKPSTLSRSFPSCLLGKQEDTVRQRTKVARTLTNRTTVTALHIHHFKMTCINISC